MAFRQPFGGGPPPQQPPPGWGPQPGQPYGQRQPGWGPPAPYGHPNPGQASSGLWAPPRYPAPMHGGWGPPPRRRGNAVTVILLSLLGIAFVVVVIAVLTALAGAPEDRGFARDRPAGDLGDVPDTAPRGSAEAVLQDNAVYETGPLTSVDCPAADLGGASLDEQEEFYAQLVGCLVTSWSDGLEEAGYSDAAPDLVVFDEPVSTPCGSFRPQTGTVLAFYCPVDAVMYADAAQMADFFGTVDVAYALVISHEYGHHVQAQTDILLAERSIAFDDAERLLDLSRRTELQASCMAGLFMAAVAESYPVEGQTATELREVSSTFGDSFDTDDDDRTHGSGESNSYWILSGFEEATVGTCNTYVAPEGLVD